MITRKHLLIAILATCLLTMFFITIVPIKSQTAGEYDPWLDNNEDGKINIIDIAATAKAFGTVGDPTKPVNVTTIPAATIEQDLNISISNGYGEGITNMFITEGYDRMFVSAAITGVNTPSSVPLNATVALAGAYWYWGIVNGTYMKTYDPVDPNRQLSISIWNASYIPISSQICSELSVKASECGLHFYAIGWVSQFFANVTLTWMSIRVSVYLTVGTTSPTDVQNTYVTNQPSIQPQPSYNNGGEVINASITSGNGLGIATVSVGGYSRMFISIEIINASYQGVPVQTTVSLYLIQWDNPVYPSSNEFVPSGTLNAIYDGINLPAYSYQTPPEFKTKSSFSYLCFSVSSGATYGWIEFYVKVYLRNE